MAAELPVKITADLSPFERALAAGKGKADELGKSLGQSKEQVALIAAGASRISPELGNAVNTASAALGVFKSMTSSMGAVAGLAAVAGAAFAKASKDLDAAEKEANEVAKTAIKAQLGIVDASYYVNQAIEAQEKVSIERRTGYWRDWARSALDAFDVVAGVIPGVATATDYYRKKLDQLDERQQSNIKTLEAARDRNIELAEAQIKVGEAAKKSQDDSHEAHAKYIADLFERRAETRALRDYEVEQEQQKQEAAQEAFDEKIKLLHAEVDAAFQAAADEIQAEQDKVDAKRQGLSDSIDVTAQFAQAGVQIATAMFGESKEIRIAEAVINTAAAVASALANPPYPPYSIPQAVAAGAMGAAQIATIASTNIAHSGLAFNPATAGQSSMAPDERVWKLRQDEGVLTGRGVRAVGGYDQVRRLNAGQPPSMGSKFVGVTQWKHHAIDVSMGENVARPAAMRTAMKDIARTGGRVGHRLRSVA